MHNVTYTRRATKALAKIDAEQAAKIRAKINQFAADPASLANNVKKLKVSKALRLRVDDYRVMFTVTLITGANGEMTILDVLNRSEAYD